MADDLEAGWHVLEDLGNVLAHLAHPFRSAARTRTVRRLVHLRDARQMLGQRRGVLAASAGSVADGRSGEVATSAAAVSISSRRSSSCAISCAMRLEDCPNDIRFRRASSNLSLSASRVLATRPALAAASSPSRVMISR